ncbi:Aldehyde dehydrogenase C-terminal [Penicillium frequentans]|uniref:Aldehyde dehydrogenase C-terminal n=1 Tax=Penicillium frequentans TaxID=3151616 RepID=A0AAD6G8Y4_9EURO|nr:Aldehyde dehydrogenase C-terminal [Penicillium glabrum]
MPFKDRVSKWKGRIRGTEKPTGQLEQNPASNSEINSSQTSSNDPQTTSNDSHTKSQPSISIKGQRNLWHEAFDKLPQNSKQELESRGMNQKTANTIEEFRKEAEKVRDKSQEREWKVQIGSHELPIRQTAVQILDWANKIGDIAIQFAPSLGAGVWAVAKFLLGGLDTFDTEKSALLSVIEKVTEAIFCGELYYGIYTLERTGRADVVIKLHDTLVGLYSCVLELLVKSSDLSSNTAVQFCRAIFDPSKPSEMLTSLEAKEKALQVAAERCEITAHALLDEALKVYLQAAQSSLDQVIQWINEEERRELLEWVSTVPYGLHHEEIEDRRSLETGDWLFQHEKFRTWMDSSSASILWLQGFHARAGLFFCNHAEKNRREALPVLRSLVRQLAAPKSNTHAARRGLREARKRATDKGSGLGLSECRHQLLDSFNSYPVNTVILDALDEMVNEELVLLIKEINNIISNTRYRTKVKIFVSSRPDEEIEVAFNSSPTVTIQATDNRNDIERFVTNELDEFGRTHPKSVVNLRKEKITEDILDKCDNMFLWAALQVKEILKCKMLESLDRALEQLPKDLSESYDRINQKIHSRPAPEMEMAHRTIQWVMAAPDPLTSEELLSAIRIKIENDAIKLKDPVDQEVLLFICENLLIVDANGQWRFFHLSVREYLQKIPEFNQQELHSCAHVCFLSLIRTFGNTEPESFPDKIDSNPSSEHLKDPFNVTNAFSQHIQRSWPFYASELTENDVPFVSLERFLGSADKSSPFFLRWSDYVFEDQDLVSFRSFKTLYMTRSEIAPFRTPIFAITNFSLCEIFVKFYEINVLDPLQLNNKGENLLYIAARSACMPILRALVSNKVGINKVLLGEAYALAASAASRSESSIALEYLVEQGADVNLPLHVGVYGSALAAASEKSDNLDTVRYLVAQGADVNIPLQAGHYGSALAAASCAFDNLDTVKYLVEQGADVNLLLQAGGYGSALAAASWESKNLDIVRYLVEQGADVNLPLQAGHYGSALVAASWASDNLDTVKYLVEQGADVDLPLQAGHYGSALAAAAYWASDNLDTVKYLVEQGADVNLLLQAGGYGSALAAASWASDNLDIVKYLVEQGADVNLLLQAGRYGSALAAASLVSNNLDIVRYLVEQGADVNLLLQAGRYGSALAAASLVSNNLDIVRYLVEQGAGVNLLLQAGRYGSALAAASWESKNLDIVRYLVEQGADVNLPLQAGHYGSALAAASWASDNLDIVRYLVEQGADVNLLLQAGRYGSALAAASLVSNNLDIVRYLVEQGADVNLLLQAGGYGSALAAASWKSKNLDTVRYLVEQEADVNLPLQAGGYGSALAAASWKSKNLDTVRYLVEQRADVNLPLRVGVFGSAVNAALSKGNGEVAAYLHSVQTTDLTAD